MSAMVPWITVKNIAGVVVGPGPIITATNWRQGKALDESRTFGFDMPASDARWMLIQSKYVCEAYGIVNGVVTLLGAGIADQNDVDAGDPTMVHIGGNDLLIELARYLVGDTRIVELGWDYLDGFKGAVKQLNPHWYYDSPHYHTGAYDAAIDLAAAYNGNKVTGETGTVIVSGLHGYVSETQHYCMVGADALYDQIRITLGALKNAQVATLLLQYPGDTGWKGLAFTNNTIVAGKPFAQDGTITFTRPSDWQRMEAANGAGNWFWIRISLVIGLEADTYDVRFTLKEIEVYGDRPTLAGVSILTTIANAQSGGAWSIVATPTTTAAYMEFAGETVLAALISLAQKTGNHFMLGSGRTITWVGPASTWPASGSALWYLDAAISLDTGYFLDEIGHQALGALTGVGAEDNPYAVLITKLSRTKDTAEIVTRLVPFAGSGATRIDLAATSRIAPAGYTLNKTPPAPMQPYLENDAAVDPDTGFGVIARTEHFDNIEVLESNSWYQSPGYAADQLFDAALAFLKTHCVEAYQYELSVTKLLAMITPATTIHCVYQEWTDGILTVDINTYPSSPLCIMGIEYEIGTEGPFIAGLELSNVERQPDSGNQAIVNTIRTVKQITMAHR